MHPKLEPWIHMVLIPAFLSVALKAPRIMVSGPEGSPIRYHILEHLY